MSMEAYPIEVEFPDISRHEQSASGIAYVHTFDSGAPGPHVMINALTHGNEVCGAITVKGLSQSISLAAPGQGYVHDTGHLSATGGGTCTVSGTTVTYTAAGSCVITARQAGNGRYADAPQVRRTMRRSLSSSTAKSRS